MTRTHGLITITMLATGLFAGAPAPASAAAATCSAPRHVVVGTPGRDTRMDVRLCLLHGTPTRGAYAHVAWARDGSGDGGRGFDALTLHYHLQRHDENISLGTCDLAPRVNGAATGDYTCEKVELRVPATGGWSADGYLEYHLDHDGAGLKRVPLLGSPVVAD
ncbi:hypothetical protein [Actinoplanes flavus]|uniref:Ig-like domain-containing protein n=1 Tax=Actinoplanes flavus TaxID=2820290 RepID=A0ABS3UZ40_9ACTN|nr:hypothetical protein [Actinoplanes flavus]MBO3743845.1 hypothetical protein [Actinoplanes flavus]